MTLPLLSPGDFFIKGNRRLEVIEVRGGTVLLKGQYGTVFDEPVQRLTENGYQWEASPLAAVHL